MADLTLVLAKTGDYLLYEGDAYLITGTMAEIGEYVLGTYGTAYNLALA